MKLEDPTVDEVIKLAGIARVKLADGRIEMFLGTELMGTYSAIPGGVRYTYPEGSEYTHTSMWGQELTDSFIRSQMWKVAVNKLMDDYTNFSIGEMFQKTR